jgi:hypothetical protein
MNFRHVNEYGSVPKLEALLKSFGGRCELTGHDLVCAPTSDFMVSFNRLDNALGYIKGNVVPWMAEFNVPSDNEGNQPTKALLKDVIAGLLRHLETGTVDGMAEHIAMWEAQLADARSETRRAIRDALSKHLYNNNARGHKSSNSLTEAEAIEMLRSQRFLCG